MLLFVLIIFISCGGKLNKNIDVQNYKSDIEEIKKNNSNKYTDADFENAGDALIGTILIKQDVSKMTYKQLLDNVKKERIESEKKAKEAMDEFEKRQQEASSLLNADITNLENVKVIGDYGSLNVTIKINNLSDKDISACVINMPSYDVFGKYVKSYDMEITNTIKSKENSSATFEIPTVFGDDKRLDVSDPNKLKFELYPKKILYTNGESIEFPEKPFPENY